MNGYIDLLSASLGGRALLCSDDFFAEMGHLVCPDAPQFDPHAYTDRGKEMDGWESRRRRSPGHDWCILALGAKGRIVGADIDTAYFLGNHPPFASIDACSVAPDTPAEVLRDEVHWTRIVAQTPLKPGSHNLAPAVVEGSWTHVRLNMYPAGGIARLRLFGVPTATSAAAEIDLASPLHGGRTLACSDMFFSPMENLIAPGDPANMGQGWETRRSRPPGRDWIILGLGQRGAIGSFRLSTQFFKGNPPDRIAIDALDWPDAPPHALTRNGDWHEIVGESRVRPDAWHTFTPSSNGPWTHVRLRIVPDGGVARLRVLGTPKTNQRDDPLLERINGSDGPEILAACCGSARWVARLLEHRPFVSRDHLFGAADEAWWHLGDGDWLQAFTHHPRIGGDVDALRHKFSAAEQAGMDDAGEKVLRDLAKANLAYEARYGFIFIVCARGKTAAEMLGLLGARMDNEPANELRIAAGEQAQITRSRLENL